ncbi:O-antigen ligase-like membrane protein [Formosa agariphila KMM 3901]|uniref:O-antigen ligase-like membrane protein n=1 Tax=Formosa agariphila (strain DSM 15362 / KCTC 12365 / LMG 23005 / KMM 3901 / M-2Alg 35-1) TaxID=1347342 RepID=T2KRV1_FORAG|nr:O-antigen ligase family protein [Formosa agariphila]CDF81216.1 O-antigen ligase-like membrane protein [Formosa agariphila KMM 3901]
MSVLNTIKKQGLNRPEETLMCLMAVTIPYMLNVGNISVVLAGVFSFYLIFTKKIDLKQYYNFGFLFPLFYFLIIIGSALTSDNVNYGLKVVNKNLLLFLIPFVLFSFKNADFKIKRILVVFALSTTLATFILLCYGSFNLISGKGIDSVFFHEFTKLYDQHPVYFALYITLSIFIVTYYSFKLHLSSVFKNKLFVFGLISILGIGLILTASKAVLFISIPLYFFLIFSLVQKMKNKLLLSGGLVVFIALLACVPIIKERFLEGIHFNIEAFQPTNNLSEAYVFSKEDKDNISDLELRYIFLKIGLYHTTEDHKLLFGYGVGDVQNYLDYYYMYYGLAPNWYEGYNVHNQYLQILVSLGIISLLFFISYLLFSIWIALKSKNILYIMFLIMITFALFFESYFERNKGIVFFIFMNTLFLIDFFRHEDRNIGHTGNT